MYSGGFLRSVWRHHTFRLGVAGLAGALVAGLVLPGSPLRVGALHGAGPEVAPAGVLAGAPAEGLVAAQAAAAQSSGAQGGQVEGIQVHGEWLIEVRNPDGTLAERREFKNALTSNGAMLLSRVMARTSSAGYWAVAVGTPSVGNTTNPCLAGQSTNPVACASVESGFPKGGMGALHEEFPTLSVSVPTSGPDANKVVLKGTVTAERDTAIDHVGTSNLMCPASSAPSNPCKNGFRADFTSKFLDTPVSVLTDQQVAITVVISFS